MNHWPKGPSPSPGTVAHGFLLDYGLTTGTTPALTLLGQGDAAAFLSNPAVLPPPQRIQ